MSSTSKLPHSQNPKNLKDIQEPLLFYFRDHTVELHFTTFKGPWNNQYAIYIYYDQWLSSSWTSFYSCLKILKFYRALLQEIYGHPVLVMIPTGYIQTLRFYVVFIIDYWQSLDQHIIQFIQRVIPDAHFCPANQHQFFYSKKSSQYRFIEC